VQGRNYIATTSRVLLTTATVAVLLMSMTGVSYQQQEELSIDDDVEEDERDEEEQECIEYDSEGNTIVINCDASFLDVVRAIDDDDILEELEVEEEQDEELEQEENGGHHYLLQASLRVADGVTFSMSSDDDLRYLKIVGDNGIIVHGRIEISDIIITSWDTETDSPVPQTDTGSIPRAFINFRVSEGGFIDNSEIGFLGYVEPPRRGIDLGESIQGPSHDLSITNSKIHDNWMGFYSSGAYNILIDGNEFYNNIKYAIDPHTGTHNMTVSNNKIYDNKGIAVICSLDCHDVVFEGNEVYNNTESGLMFSRATHDSIIRNNTIYNQYGSAYPISISESQNNEIYDNIITNSTFGISLHNPVELAESGMSTDNSVYNNTFDGVQYGIRAAAASDNTFSDNVFGNVTDFHYIMTFDAGMIIEDQDFDMVNIRGVSGANTVTIQDSGTIIVDHAIPYDTDEEPFTEVLSFRTLNVNSTTE
jgi:mannuronan 5-epimerase